MVVVNTLVIIYKTISPLEEFDIKRHALYTPQQKDDVAERKHRHFVDMVLSLLSKSFVHITFWSFAFAINVFLINRLPSPSLLLNFFFFRLMIIQFFLSFGCACYSLLRPCNSKKIHATSYCAVCVSWLLCWL